jgi:hypothetical protein
MSKLFLITAFVLIICAFAQEQPSQEEMNAMIDQKVNRMMAERQPEFLAANRQNQQVEMSSVRRNGDRVMGEIRVERQNDMTRGTADRTRQVTRQAGRRIQDTIRRNTPAPRRPIQYSDNKSMKKLMRRLARKERDLERRYAHEGRSRRRFARTRRLSRRLNARAERDLDRR